MRILTDATRQFSSITRPSLAEINAYKDMFYQLIGACDSACRRAIAASLASFAYTPTPIAVFLASDAAEVATPMLMFSPTLGEDHIVQARRPPAARSSARVVSAQRPDGKGGKALIENGGEETRAGVAVQSGGKSVRRPGRTGPPACATDPKPQPAQAEPVSAKSELLRLAGNRRPHRPREATERPARIRKTCPSPGGCCLPPEPAKSPRLRLWSRRRRVGLAADRKAGAR